MDPNLTDNSQFFLASLPESNDWKMKVPFGFQLFCSGEGYPSFREGNYIRLHWEPDISQSTKPPTPQHPCRCSGMLIPQKCELEDYTFTITIPGFFYIFRFRDLKLNLGLKAFRKGGLDPIYKWHVFPHFARVFEGFFGPHKSWPIIFLQLFMPNGRTPF